MTADVNETKAARRKLPPVGAMLFGANAVTQFAIQAWLAYGFAKHVWKLGGFLPWLVPVALDVFAIALMYATYQLRDAPIRQRAYAWCWLGVAIAAQVGASEGYAAHEKWGVWGRGASVVPAVFLAASLHAMIIVVRRTPSIPADLLAAAEARPGWWARRRTARAVAAEIKAERLAIKERPVFVQVDPRITMAAAHQVALASAPVDHAAEVRPIAISFPRCVLDPAPDQQELPAGVGHLTPEQIAHAEQVGQQAAAEAADASRAPRRERQATARGKGQQATGGGRTGRPADPRRADVIKRCVDGSEPTSAVAVDLGVNVRTAQLWVKAERAERSGAHGT